MTYKATVHKKRLELKQSAQPQSDLQKLTDSLTNHYESIMNYLSKPSLILQLFSSLLLLTWLGCGSKKDPAPSTKTPVLGVVSISEVKTTSAKATCTLKDVGFGASGSSTIKDYGVCYATTENPTTASAKISAGTSATATTDFSASLTGLTAGTKYFVRAYVLHEGDPVYSEQATFTTDNLKAPEVTTADAADLTTTTFSMTGKLTNLGTSDVTQFGHVLSETNLTPTTADTKTEMGAASAVPKDFKSVFGSLKLNTTYYVRAYATNATGTGYSEVKTVKMANDQPPAVTTGDISNVTYNAATVGMNITSVGTNNTIQAGVCWSSTNQTPTTADSKTSNGASSTQFFSNSVTSLSPGTTYYVRAYATNSVGTSYGDVKNFKTADVPLPVVTKPVNPSGTVGITTLPDLRFTVSYSASIPITEVGLCYSTTNQNPTIGDSKKTTGAGTGDKIVYLDNLQPNTTYYVRAYAQTSAGVGYSPVSTLKTAALVPPVISGIKLESTLLCASSTYVKTVQSVYNEPCCSTAPAIIDNEIKVSFTYEARTETPARFGICLSAANQSADPTIDNAKIESGNAYSSLLGGYFSARFNVVDKSGNTKLVNCAACTGGVQLCTCGKSLTATEYTHRNLLAPGYTVLLVSGGTAQSISYKYRAYVVMTNGNVYYGPTTTIDPTTLCRGPG